MLKDALLYAQFGWAVFPTVPNSKTPHGKTQGFKESTKADAKVHQFWSDYPDSNIGIATGIVSGIVVLDVDNKKNVNGELALEDLERQYGKLPETVEQFTPSGGRHLFFKYPQDATIQCSSSQIGKGLDIRANGGYVLVAPSVVDFKKYVWEGAHSPFEFPLADLPEWLMWLISSKKRDWKIDLNGKDKIIEETKRNERMFEIAFQAQRQGLNTFETLFPHLLAINVTHCKPPLEEKEIRTICESALNYQPDVSSNTIDKKEEIKWDISKDGKLKNTYRNALNFFKSDEKLYDLFKHNEFTKRIELSRKPFWITTGRWSNNHSDNDVMQIKQYLTTRNLECSTNNLREAIQTISFNHRYNPVTDYLDSLQWDGVKRVENFFHEYMKSEDTTYTRFISKLLFCSAVKRAYHPGCEYQYMIILEGKQGIGKTLAIKALGKPWSGRVNLLDRDKDTIDKMQGLWLIEVPELEMFKKKEVESIKSFIDEPMDRARLAYGHTTEEFPRHSIFIGTINPTEMGYLRDATGNRRFLPVACNDDIDVQAIELSRDQFFAEAKILLKEGFKIYVDKEMNQEALIQQDLRLALDAWEERVTHYLENCVSANSEITTTQIWTDALKGDISKFGRGDQMRIGSMLRKLHYQPKILGLGGKTTKRVYVKEVDVDVSEWTE